MKFEINQGIECPRCHGNWNKNNVECNSCQKGVIPYRTLKFIVENFIEYEDHYLCQYNHIINPTAIVEIHFKVIKENFAVFALIYGGPFDIDIPRNTVKIIDKMKTDFTQGEYIRLDTNEE